MPPVSPTTTATPPPGEAAIDRRRWRAAERAQVDEPLDAVPQSVSRSSLGRPWHGLTVWHQLGPAEDLYVPPARKHCLIVRRGSATRLLQQHGGVSASRTWSPGEVVLLPADTPSFWRTELPRDNLHVDLSPQWLQRAADSDGAAVRLRSCFGARDPIVAQLAQALLASLDSNTSLQPGFSDGIAMSLAVHLLEHYRDEAAQPAPRRVAALSAQQMRRIAESVDDALDAAWPLARLAAEVRLSPFHFARSFKATCGLTPHQFVTRRRMERARELVLATREPLLQIAQETGYASAAHFAQAYRRHWGEAPSATRRG